MPRYWRSIAEKMILTTLTLLLCVSFFGCSSIKKSSNELHFNEIVKGNIAKISSRNAGNGLLYSITDKKKIDSFVNLMNSTTYSRVEAYEPITGSGIGLYNENNVMISVIASNGKGVYHIGDGYYKTTRDISAELSSFYKELYRKENIVPE